MTLERSKGCLNLAGSSSSSSSLSYTSDDQLEFERNVERAELNNEGRDYGLINKMTQAGMYQVVGEDLYMRAVDAVTINMQDITLERAQYLSTLLNVRISFNNLREGEAFMIANVFLGMALHFDVEELEHSRISNLGIHGIIKLLSSGGLEALDVIRRFFQATKESEQALLDERGYLLYDLDNLSPEDQFELSRTASSIKRGVMAREIVLLMQDLHMYVIDDDFHFLLTRENISKKHQKECHLGTLIAIFAKELLAEYSYDGRIVDYFSDWKLLYWEEILAGLKSDYAMACTTFAQVWNANRQGFATAELDHIFGGAPTRDMLNQKEKALTVEKKQLIQKNELMTLKINSELARRDTGSTESDEN